MGRGLWAQPPAVTLGKPTLSKRQASALDTTPGQCTAEAPQHNCVSSGCTLLYASKRLADALNALMSGTSSTGAT